MTEHHLQLWRLLPPRGCAREEWHPCHLWHGRCGEHPHSVKAAAALGDDIDPDYWTPTEGNAKRPLLQLIAMAKMRPDGIWDGD